MNNRLPEFRPMLIELLAKRLVLASTREHRNEFSIARRMKPSPTPKTYPMNIEPIELRIAPASVFVTYTDVDGDLVKITASRAGTIVPPLDATDLSFVSGGASGQLSRLDLTDPAFGDVSIVFSVTRKPGGDGLAHVGFIDAAEVDLDRVVVKGDLGRIDAGEDVSTSDSGLNLLQVRTFGTLGLVTQGGAGDLESTIKGRLGALKVAGDYTDAQIFVTVPGGANTSDASIGSIFIGGDVTGGGGQGEGTVLCLGPLGSLKINGDLRGGDGDNSGAITSNTSMGDVRIGGSVVGGAGDQSGGIRSVGPLGSLQIGGDLIVGAGAATGQVRAEDTMGSVRVGGDVSGQIAADEIKIVKIGRDLSGRLEGNDRLGTVQIGGDVRGTPNGSTGQIQSFGTIGNVTIGGDLIGGTGSGTGILSANRGMGHVRIAGDLIGGSIKNDESLFNSGLVASFSGGIASVTIGGSLIAGTDDSTAALDLCGGIVAETLGPIKIGGSIIGNRENAVLIMAEGQEIKPATGFDIAIASVTVSGDVRFASILAGYVGSNLFPVNADASIGPIKVGGDWAASSLVAGAEDAGDPDFGIGDTLQNVGNTSLVARIASIIIKGDANGSLEGGDHFGFVAQQIDKLRIGARTFILGAGPSNDNVAIPFTDDLRLLEV